MPPTSFDATVRLAILRAFIDGRPTPTAESVATELGELAESVAESFGRLAAAHVLVLAPNARDIRMSAPFSGGVTDFVTQVGARRYHANCIWDALGIPALLGGADGPVDAEVHTHCADCGEELALVVRSGAVHAEPASAVAHFAVPAARWWDDIGFT